MQLLTESNLLRILKRIGLAHFFRQLITQLQQDYARWDDFSKIARHATEVANGVIELMPIADQSYWACKYVNGHPHNPQQGRATVIGLGLLADVATGYPLLISEMTILTAIRTAAMAAAVAQYLAVKDSKCLAIIGCGAQSEFQVLAHAACFPLQRIQYYDLDAAAMQKFADNLTSHGFELVPMQDVASCVQGADIVITATTVQATTSTTATATTATTAATATTATTTTTTATAASATTAGGDDVAAPILSTEGLLPHVHIQAIGGDCPGKNELTLSLLQHAARVIIEFAPQTQHEGEIERLTAEHAHRITPFYQLAQQGLAAPELVPLRQQLTVFDSVGFALEDYSTLVYLQQLRSLYPDCFSDCDLIPAFTDPKNLYACLRGVT